jgi:hypothetical protein
MKGHECYHCKQWVEAGEAHDCWTTTETALTRELAEDLQDAYQRIRETAVELGEQRIYASHHSIMFSRKACHFFVKPKRNFLEFIIFLGRAIKAPQIKKVHESSKVKRAHVVHIRHRDEVESPITDWMKEAYELQDQLAKVKSDRVKVKSTSPRAKQRKVATPQPKRKAKKRRRA